MGTNNFESETISNKFASKLTPLNLILKDELNMFKPIEIDYKKSCTCPNNHLNCLSAKEWLKRQLGVWEFFYEKRDIRDKNMHPATFPISLARQVIDLFTHEEELVIDPFVGSGTTLPSWPLSLSLLDLFFLFRFSKFAYGGDVSIRDTLFLMRY